MVIDAMLSDVNIRNYLTAPDHSYVLSQDFLCDPSCPWGQKRPSSPSSASSKGKRPKVGYDVAGGVP